MQSQSLIPLTLDEHRELGREMRETALRLQELCALVVGVYGPHNRAAFNFQKATEALDQLRQDLQTQASLDLPGVPVDDIYL